MRTFRQSLFVLTQIISMPNGSTAVVDAGLKALAFDSGLPTVHDLADVAYSRPSDEHGVLDTSNFPNDLQLGTKLKLVPGHCDPTVNLYNHVIGIRKDRVEAMWPIAGRCAQI